MAQKLKKALEEEEERFPAFPLIDPLKRFAPQDFGWAEEWTRAGARNRSLRASPFPASSTRCFPQAIPVPNRDDPIDTTSLLRRIRSLKDALDNLPRHAKRLARWKARNELSRQPGAVWKPGRLSPFRPGLAPGKHVTEERQIDVILGDCHYFARQAWADTS